MIEPTSKPLSVIENTSLVKGLFALQQQKLTGMAKVTAIVTETGKELQCLLFFQDGFIALAERKNISPLEFVAALASRLKVSCLDDLMKYVANRINVNQATIGELLDRAVSTRAMKWEDIERVVSERIVIIVEQFLPYACTIQVLNHQDLGITYSNDRRGISCDEILQRVGQRQTKWKQYLPAIRSIDAIPKVREGAIESIEHQASKHHLLKWVDGERSFAEIAVALDQDPLALAPLYFRWANEKVIDFSFGSYELAAKALPVILSVDDSPVVQTLIRRNLSKNYEVISVSNAMDALGVLGRRDVNLILLDVTMPEIDGFEFCRTIRKMNKFKNTPVIMLTAKDGLIDRARGHMAGTNRYLTKPVDKDELVSAVQEFIQ